MRVFRLEKYLLRFVLKLVEVIHWPLEVLTQNLITDEIVACIGWVVFSRHSIKKVIHVRGTKIKRKREKDLDRCEPRGPDPAVATSQADLLTQASIMSLAISLSLCSRCLANSGSGQWRSSTNICRASSFQNKSSEVAEPLLQGGWTGLLTECHKYNNTNVYMDLMCFLTRIYDAHLFH